MTHALVTGASGFIGYHFVRRLSQRGDKVTCLVRPGSDRNLLEPFSPTFAIGDVADCDSVGRAISSSVDVVYHLAGMTKSIHKQSMMDVNVAGTRNVAAACAQQNRPPVLIVVSSVSAAGPTKRGVARNESEVETPVSTYGKSKRAGELAAIEFADQVPTTIIRPSIVLGEADHDGFILSKNIAKTGVHFVPGLVDNHFSLIHAEDLAIASLAAAEKGIRATSRDITNGIYFAADTTMTYADLGRLIGAALGRKRTYVVRVPGPLLWSLAAFGEVKGRIQKKPSILNFDKAREATAGSWTCSTEKLRDEIGFTPAKSFADRMAQTIQWYREAGWF